MPRIYDASTSVAPQPFNVTQPFRPDGAPFLLARWSGKWKHVKYAGNFAPSAFYSKPFDEGEVVGIYSTGFADCTCLCLLAGRVNKHTGDYYSGALAHLNGGDIDSLDIGGFIAGTGYTRSDIKQGSAVNAWFFHLVLAGNTYGLTTFMLERTLSAIESEIGIADHAITVYRGGISEGFGITAKGWTGVPVFGHTGSAAPLYQDSL